VSGGGLLDRVRRLHPGLWLPALLIPVSFLSDPGAALPGRTYFFRDFTATFFPLRLFAAREMRQGRVAFWNPYVFEGTFQLPTLYPPDLALALQPGAATASWLLALHLPLAALGAYWLARELGASRLGAFVAGTVYALGGLAVSSLNLYVFLQALAFAPFVAGLTRRAALTGSRRAVGAALVLALALSTLAVEFVAQAAVLGAALGLVARPTTAGLRRVGLVLLLGVGLASVPVFVVLGLLPETARGTGFAREVALGNAVHPAVLLQTVMPRLFGLPSAPAEAWWGGRFYSKGLPYFLTLYMGPLTLALASLGTRRVPRAVRWVLLALAGMGLWYALGDFGGLAPLVSRLPAASAFRFPSKALLLPYLVTSLLAGLGLDALEGGAAGRAFVLRLGALGALAAAVAAGLWWASPGLVSWTGVAGAYWPHLVSVARADAAVVVGLGAAATALAVAAGRGILRPRVASGLVAALVVADLARAGAGVNRQVSPSFFRLLPEMEALPLRDPAGGRTFSYSLDHSPTFREFLGRGHREATLASFFVYRQILGPYTNVLDEIEAPEATDLTAFVPRERELGPGLYAPEAIERLLPWLRNAAVSRVLSLDALASDDLEPLAVVETGPPDLGIHVYRLRRPWPRAFVACHVIHEPDPEKQLLAPYSPSFDPRKDVALAGGLGASCSAGETLRLNGHPGEDRYRVELDGEGFLVVRASYARGWRAWVDGSEVPVRRGDGKHRAVGVPAGRHEVVMRYDPPGLLAGLAATGLSALVAAGAWIAGGRRGGK
jgi:hypothetical protein